MPHDGSPSRGGWREIADLAAAHGISGRQLSYWRAQGAFEAVGVPTESGSGSRIDWSPLVPIVPALAHASRVLCELEVSPAGELGGVAFVRKVCARHAAGLPAWFICGWAELRSEPITTSPLTSPPEPAIRDDAHRPHPRS